MTDKIIQGAGGPPRPPQPQRTPDTLNSHQFATIQDLLSEGEIEGFATPSKRGIAKSNAAYTNASLCDIFLENTPILDIDENLNNTQFLAKATNPSDSDFNFQNVQLQTRFGTANQSHIAGIENAPASPQIVGVDVVKGTPVVRTISDTNVDAVKVTITFPQLQKATDKGDLLGSSVRLKINIKYNNQSSSTTKVDDTITGRSGDSYSKDYRINLDFSVSGRTSVEIEVERVTDNASNPTELKDVFQFTQLQKLFDDKEEYPNSAYTNLRLDSEQFSSIPKRAFRIRGIKVRIPASNSSGTVTVDNQTGRIIYPQNYVFDGTLGAAQWCSCPAMILLDLLTSERYGLGTHITLDNLDLYTFVSVSRYSNALVDDFNGGQEARFSCNVNIQSSSEAFDLINDLAGVMRCIPIWAAGSITLSQDSPKTPAYLFSLANVTDEGFNYTGSSLKQRHSVVSVSYFNMESREMDFEIYEDADAIAKLGTIPKRVKSFGTTSRGQALRIAKAILFSEQQESEVVNFSTSIDAGAIVRPGTVITINDPVRGGVRRSGRIKSVNTAKTQITVDNVADLDSFSGTNQKMYILKPDGQVEFRNISSITNDVITVSSAFSVTPNVNAMWLIESDSLLGQTFRVISIEEEDGVNYNISALTYVEGKYNNIENNTPLQARPISLLNQLKDPPSVTSQPQEKVVVRNNVAINKLFLSWQAVSGVTQYLVQFRFEGSNWISETVFRPDFEILNAEAGQYEFKLFSYNANLQLSKVPTTITYNAIGKSKLPEQPQNLSIEPVNHKLIRLRWTQSTDADVIHGGRVYIRHSSKTDGSGTFQNSVDLIEAVAGNSTDAVVPALEGEYIIKFQDDGGRFCLGETSVIIDMPDVIDEQIVLTDREDLDNPTFGGAKANLSVVNDTLQLTNPASNASGTYDFSTILDLGAVYSLSLKRILDNVGFVIGDFIDNIPNFDLYATNGSFDGEAVNSTNAKLLVATTNTAPSGSSYVNNDFNTKPFNTFANGIFKGRGFRFRLLLETSNVNHNISINEGGVLASFESRTERQYIDSNNNVSTAAIDSGTNVNGIDVTFANKFFTGTTNLGGTNLYPPSIGITIQNANAGEYFVLKTNASGAFLNAAGSDITGLGFNIKILDSSNNPVNKKFTFQAVGYGKGV